MSDRHSSAETSLNGTAPIEALEITTAGPRSRRSIRLFLRSDFEPPAYPVGAGLPSTMAHIDGVPGEEIRLSMS